MQFRKIVQNGYFGNEGQGKNVKAIVSSSECTLLVLPQDVAVCDARRSRAIALNNSSCATLSLRRAIRNSGCRKISAIGSCSEAYSRLRS